MFDVLIILFFSSFVWFFSFLLFLCLGVWVWGIRLWPPNPKLLHIVGGQEIRATPFIMRYMLQVNRFEDYAVRHVDAFYKIADAQVAKK